MLLRESTFAAKCVYSRLLHSTSKNKADMMDDLKTVARRLFADTPYTSWGQIQIECNRLNFPGHSAEVERALRTLGLPELAGCLVWVPWDRLEDVEELGRGGFATVYRGTIRSMDERGFAVMGYDKRKVDVEEWRRLLARGEDTWWNYHVRWERTKEWKVALKEVDNFLINEMILTAHISFHSNFTGMATMIGLTRNPITFRHVMVMLYYPKGNMESASFLSLPDSWPAVCQRARRLARSLREIHHLGLTHGDIHGANVVFDAAEDPLDLYPNIIDVGLGKPIGESRGAEGVYGRLQCLPPEMIYGEHSTQASDVYCLGILLWQNVTRVPPKGTAANLWRKDGMREDPVPGLPRWYEELYCQCWNVDPKKRPTAQEVLERVVEHVGNPEDDEWVLGEETVQWLEERRRSWEEEKKKSLVNGMTDSFPSTQSSFFTLTELEKYTREIKIDNTTISSPIQLPLIIITAPTMHVMDPPTVSGDALGPPTTLKVRPRLDRVKFWLGKLSSCFSISSQDSRDV
ncbi:kinase-like domain-containing protein [Endogone sp. FLAS-F59071]|nr:kinase-like domain-containing protein [Endogone sp. FLAS-F59071]|eukprot:RUS13649.1 kinase-like domain-containing protein [Endogone sp. FLAS-F59071]